MRTVTVQEASLNLKDLLHCAVEGEEVTIRDGACTVLLQPVYTAVKNRLQGRDALRKLQSQSQLTARQADSYLREVRAERLAHENGHE